MKGTASLYVNEAKLTKLIPEARKRYKEDIADKTGELYFVQEHEANVEIHDITNDAIGFEIETPFGSVNIWLTPDRKFLADVADVAITRTTAAIKILNNEKI